MSKALSVDLRVRVLAAVAQGLTHREAAERFGVSAASVSRWRKREREHGDPRPRALGGDRRSNRIEAHHEAVMAALGPGGDATIEEVRRTLRSRACLRLRHDPALLRTPRHHAQKKTAHATEQDRPDVLKRGTSNGSRINSTLIPIGSSSSTRPGPPPTWPGAMAAARRGERLRVGVPHGHWKTTTFVGALTRRGFIAPWVLDGPINRDAFETYVAKVLVPELRPGDIVVMDNLSSHKGPRVREMIEAAGAEAALPAALQP